MAQNSNKRVFPTQYSESVQKGTFETFHKPSLTEPDNAMSIPEIIAKFTRGYGIPVDQHPWSSGDAFGEGDPNDMSEFMPKAPEAPQEQPKAPEAPKEPEAPEEPAPGA